MIINVTAEEDKGYFFDRVHPAALRMCGGVHYSTRALA